MNSRFARVEMGGWALLVLMLLLCPALSAIPAESDGAALEIILYGESPMLRSMSALESMPAVSIRVQDDSGSNAEYTCTPLSTLLAASGVEFGKTVRGERLSDYVLVSASDGYRALFSIVEVDPAFRKRPVLLCYAKDGSDLPEKEGRLRMVVGDEDRRARWVKQVKTISVGTLP